MKRQTEGGSSAWREQRRAMHVASNHRLLLTCAKSVQPAVGGDERVVLGTDGGERDGGRPHTQLNVPKPQGCAKRER